MCTDFKIVQVKVPVIFFGTLVFSACRDRRYISRLPLITRTLFNTPTAIIAYIGTLIQGLIVWSLLYYMPLYFEVTKNYSPINSSVALFPFTFTIMLVAVVVSLVVSKALELFIPYSLLIYYS